MNSRRRFLVGMLFGLALVVAAVVVAAVRSGHNLAWFVYRASFELYLRRDRAEIEKQSTSGESNVYYFTSYYMNGLLSAAEATHSRRIMKRTVHYLDNMVNSAVPISNKQRDYRVWGPFDITPASSVRKPNLHATLQAAVPVARAAAIIRHDPAFRDRYAANAENYVNFVKDAVFEYWYSAEYDKHLPWLESETGAIWNENATNIGICAAFMFEATGDPAYADIAKRVGAAFQAKLSVTGRGWIWESNTIPIGSDTDNTPGSVGNQAGVPDTARTNREAMLMITLYEAGLMFSKEDIQRLGYTLTDSLWNQSTDAPAFSNYITGSNKPYRVYKEPGLNGVIYSGWALTGGYLPEAQSVVASTLKAIQKDQHNPSLERNSTGYGGMLSLTGAALRNLSLLRNAK